MLECQEGKPQAGQTRIYRPLKQIESLALSLSKLWGHRTLRRRPRTLDPCVRCSNVSHESPFETLVLESNGNLQSTGR